MQNLLYNKKIHITSFYIVISKYLTTKIADTINVRILISLSLPANNLSIQYVISPRPIPLAIEYVNGINTYSTECRKSFIHLWEIECLYVGNH